MAFDFNNQGAPAGLASLPPSGNAAPQQPQMQPQDYSNGFHFNANMGQQQPQQPQQTVGQLLTNDQLGLNHSQYDPNALAQQMSAYTNQYNQQVAAQQAAEAAAAKAAAELRFNQNNTRNIFGGYNNSGFGINTGATQYNTFGSPSFSTTPHK